MIHPDKYLDEIGNIQVISISGELVMYYDKYPDKLAEKLEDEKHHDIWINAGLANKNITCATACIFDKSTERYSDTSIYKDDLRSSKGYYFKKSGKRYRFNIDITN
jgi:hypothetical protein